LFTHTLTEVTAMSSRRFRSKTLVGNSDLMLVLDPKKRWTNIITPQQIYDITQNYGWYEGSPGQPLRTKCSSTISQSVWLS